MSVSGKGRRGEGGRFVWNPRGGIVTASLSNRCRLKTRGRSLPVDTQLHYSPQRCCLRLCPCCRHPPHRGSLRVFPPCVCCTLTPTITTTTTTNPELEQDRLLFRCNTKKKERKEKARWKHFNNPLSCHTAPFKPGAEPLQPRL